MKERTDMVIPITGHLSVSYIEKCKSKIWRAKRQGCPLFVVVDSCGGNMKSALDFAQILEDTDLPMVARGIVVGSAALPIFLAIESRRIEKSGKVLIHEPSFSMSDIDNICDKYGADYGQELLSFLESKQSKYTKAVKLIMFYTTCLTKKAVNRLFSSSNVPLIDANQAVKFGIAQDIA